MRVFCHPAILPFECAQCTENLHLQLTSYILYTTRSLHSYIIYYYIKLYILYIIIYNIIYIILIKG